MKDSLNRDEAEAMRDALAAVTASLHDDMDSADIVITSTENPWLLASALVGLFAGTLEGIYGKDHVLVEWATMAAAYSGMIGRDEEKS